MPRSASSADRQPSAERLARARASREQRYGIVKALYVSRDATKHIAEQIDKVRRSCALSPEPRNILIVGETGVGKSALLQHYLAQHPKRREPSGSLVQPVLFVAFDSFLTAAGAAKLMLKELEDPSAGTGNLVDLTERIRVLVREQRVEVLMLDEFQHIVDTGSKTVSKIADLLKQLSKSVNRPLVMTGMPDARRIIEGNQQLAGITPYRHELGMLLYRKDGDRRIFRVFLAQVDDALPFQHLAGLGDADIAETLFAVTNGNLRTLMHLIREAAGHAIDREAACVGLDDLAYGFDQVEAMSPLAENPFADRGMLLPRRRLDATA